MKLHISATSHFWGKIVLKSRNVWTAEMDEPLLRGNDNDMGDTDSDGIPHTEESPHRGMTWAHAPPQRGMTFPGTGNGMGDADSATDAIR